MPLFARLLERAAELDIVPTLPAQTAPGWMTIASGAHPSTLGIENILLSVPDAAPNVITNGFDRRRSRGEYLWETLDAQGFSSVVLKYPGSWPPRTGGFVQVDGAGGYADISCRFEVAPSVAYVNASPDPEGPPARALFPEGYEEYYRIDTSSDHGYSTVVTRDPVGWRDLPEDAEPAFELVLHVEQRGRRAHRVFHGLAYRRGAEEILALSSNKSAGPGALHLRAGDWSGWVRDEGASGAFSYRFKLLHLDVAARAFKLYRSEGHQLEGFTQPTTLARELTEELGPFPEWTGTYDLMNGLVDLDTQLEIYAQHTDWLAAAIRRLGRSTPWTGFFMHWHVIEYAHHLVGASLHPEHPLHRPERVEAELRFLGETYALADRLLAAAEEVSDEETLLVVASDHGHDLVHTIFYVNHFLWRHGWLAAEVKGGKPVIDWSRTRAYALFPGCIHFNTKGRWSGGVVDERDAAGLAEEITEALQGLVDARTRRHFVKLVLDRTELGAFGQWGPRAPDLFFCLARGYEPASRLALGGESTELEITVPGKEVTSGHGSFFPASASARTLALLAGPGIPPGSRYPHPLPIVDLAPTMAAFLGVAPPRDCDGRSIDLSRLEGRP